MSESQELNAEATGTTAPGRDCGLTTLSDGGSCSPSPGATGDGAGDRCDARVERDPVVLLIAPRWAAPARPALLIAPELNRRWGGHPRLLVVDDPDDDLLDALDVEAVPTWLRFEVREACAQASSESSGPTQDQRSTPVDQLLRTFAFLVTSQVNAADHAHSDAEELTRLAPCENSRAAAGDRSRWVETARLTGAQPKHAVDTALGDPRPL